MDLDGFKAANDRHGHRAGSTVLVHVARLLKNTLRSQDFVARSGGDEFVAILFQTDARAAVELATQIVDAVRDDRIDLPSGESVSVGISIGCSAFPDAGETVDALFSKADALIFQDKYPRGRSRTPLAAAR